METEEKKVLLISDVYKFREEKERELKYYKECLTQLETKLYWVRKEIDLTNIIIKLIENEQIEDLSKVVKIK